MSSDSKKYYHKKGQGDAKKRDYDEPHGIMDDLTTWSDSGMKKNIEDNKSYREGYANTKGQSDGARNSYNPPSDKDAKKAYDEAWRDSYDNEKSKSSGCFITTACVQTMGLSDDCDELSVLRQFRDSYLASRPDGGEMIADYYIIAPQIVKAINRAPEASLIYANLFAELVKPAVDMIRAGQHDAAVAHYRSHMERLGKTYLPKDSA
jgi:hypothetical protein